MREMPEIEDYRKNAREDAADTVEHFLDETAEQLVENGKASNDMYNDYPDGDAYHHETHVDKSYNLLEAAHLLNQLIDHEADDSGLWEGLAPKEAISVMAAYTYGNAVYDFWRDLIEKINEEVEAEGKWGPTGPKEWSPHGGMPLSWAKRVIKQVVKNWRK
jgi:hypothetical protein